MSEDRPPQPHDRSGLIILALINICLCVAIGGEVLSITNWKTAQSNSYTVAEAAYLGSFWTKVLVYIVGLLAFNVFCLGIGICLRVTQMHRAVLWQAGARPPA